LLCEGWVAFSECFGQTLAYPACQTRPEGVGKGKRALDPEPKGSQMRGLVREKGSDEALPPFAIQRPPPEGVRELNGGGGCLGWLLASGAMWSGS
jgi:hypothetical protein